jgi:SEC-C motif-containing protein
VTKELGYILESLHPDQRSDYDERSTRAWAERATWHGLTILRTAAGGPDDEEGEVEFVAAYDERGERHNHHEVATFRRRDGVWYFENGAAPPVRQVVREAPKIGRNDPCPCGSGRKHKKCCGT